LKFPEETGGLLEPDFIAAEKADQEIKDQSSIPKPSFETRVNTTGIRGRAADLAIIHRSATKRLDIQKPEREDDYSIPPAPASVPIERFFKSTKTEPVLYYLPNK
jgi:hypothetical protein